MLAARIPPQDLEAEQAALGACLMDGGAIDRVAALLTPEAFYREAHKILFAAITDMRACGEPVDLTTLASELEMLGTLAQAGGRPYLASLLEAVPTVAHAEHYARLVLQKATLRRLIAAATEMVEECYAGSDDPQEVLSRAEAALREIGEGQQQGRDRWLREGVCAALERAEERMGSPQQVPGVPSGISRLDQFTGGFQDGDLVLVAARPSMGKSALGLGIALAAAQAGRRVRIISCEMSEEQLEVRFLQMEGRVPSERLRSGLLTEWDWQRLTQAAALLYHLPVYYTCETPTVEEIAARCRVEKARHGLGLVIVDYLQLVRAQKRTDGRTQEVDHIARSLRRMAQELNIPVVALAQLNRQVEGRSDRRPLLSDLRESGSLESEASLVVMPYRPGYYDKQKEEEEAENPEEVEPTEMVIPKNRNGRTGLVRCGFQRAYARFVNFQEEE